MISSAPGKRSRGSCRVIRPPSSPGWFGTALEQNSVRGCGMSTRPPRRGDQSNGARLMFHTRPADWSVRRASQLKSTSYHARPCRALVGCAWWLLCHPSPNVSSATHQLFVESSCVSKRRAHHFTLSEFPSHVACSPTVVRKKIPQSTYGSPP